MKWRIILMITFCIIVYGALFSGCTEATEREIIDDATNTESVLVICSEQDYKPDIDIIITDFETQTGQKSMSSTSLLHIVLKAHQSLRLKKEIL